MDDSPGTSPVFLRPPVIETRIGIQFSPLVGLRSGHFGLFWHSCLGVEGWRIRKDLVPLPKEREQFGDKALRPPSGDEDEEEVPGVRMWLVKDGGAETVQFQANRLVYAWTREQDRRPSYLEIKEKVQQLWGRLEDFARDMHLPRPIPNLWEVAYYNTIPQGRLWSKPSDWHSIFPGLFSSDGPMIDGCPWATFSGDWFFEIPPELGRVKVRVQKSIQKPDPRTEVRSAANPGGDLVLLVIVTARGEIGGNGVGDWQSGTDLGHRAARQVFLGHASERALAEWGIQE